MEALEKYEKITNDMLVKHNLTDWKFIWNNRTTTKTFGICKYRLKEIHLNKKFALVEKTQEVIDTIIHEIAHALTKGDGHGERWRAKCRELGCKDEQFANTDKETLNKLARYRGVCPTCGHEIFTSRKTDIIHIQCSNKEYRETGKTNYMKHKYEWFKNDKI